MPQNMPQQILQRICPLAGRFSARSSQDAGVVSRMHKQNFTTQPRDWPTTSAAAYQRKRGGSMKISTPREDRQLLPTSRFISAPRLRMQMIRLFGRRMSVRTIRIWLLAAGFEWGRRHRAWDLRQWRHRIFSDESGFSLYHSDGRVRVCRRQVKRLIDVCVQPNDVNRGPSVMVWGTIHHGGRGELVVVDVAMNRHRCVHILRNQMLPWVTGVFGRKCTSKTMPRPIQHVTRQPLWTNRMLRSWTGQLGVQT